MRTGRGLIAGLALAALLAACQALPPPPPPPQPAANPPAFSQVGLASWYGPGLNRQPTATGERFDMNALTAAHRTLPLNSLVRVTNLDNGRSVVVRINDRGPFAANRVIDLSAKAARELGMKDNGIARVRLELVSEAAL
jgi:rare lipoprotein A